MFSPTLPQLVTLLALPAALLLPSVWPAGAAAACVPGPACLEATFPGAYSWGALSPAGGGANVSAEEVTSVTSTDSWGLRVSSDLPGGRMTGWDGAVYSGTALTSPLQWALTRIGAAPEPSPSYQALSGSPAAVVSAQPSTCDVSRRRFPRENVLPRAMRDIPLTLTTKLPRGNYRARVVTRDGHRASVRKFGFRLVGPNELAASGLSIVSLPTPQPDAGDDFDSSVQVKNTGNLAFAPQGKLVLRERDGRVIAERTVPVDRLDPGAEGTGKAGLPAVADGTYRMSIRFEEGDRVLAERTLAFTTGAAPPLLARILDWLAGHLPLVFEASLAATASQPARNSGPPPLLVAGLASVAAFLLGESRARKR